MPDPSCRAHVSSTHEADRDVEGHTGIGWFITEQHASACSFTSARPMQSSGLAFSRRFKPRASIVGTVVGGSGDFGAGVEMSAEGLPQATE